MATLVVKRDGPAMELLKFSVTRVIDKNKSRDEANKESVSIKQAMVVVAHIITFSVQQLDFLDQETDVFIIMTSENKMCPSFFPESNISRTHIVL